MIVLNLSINADSRLQIVLWEPNKNVASKIINEFSNKNCDSKKSSENNSDQEQSDEVDFIDIEKSKFQFGSDYKVEEPFEFSCKKSLKRSYSQVNKILIEEIDYKNENLNQFIVDASNYYIVDEPVVHVEKKVVKDDVNKNKVTISELYDDSDSMEL